MKVIPALPAECQVQTLKKLWRNLAWLPPGEVLLTPDQPSDRLYVVVRGEAELLMGSSDYTPLLPEGSFICEMALLQDYEAMVEPLSGIRNKGGHLWSFRGWKRIPASVLSIVEEYLGKKSIGPCVVAKVRTTQRSLVTSLTNRELRSIARSQGEETNLALSELIQTPASQNALLNVGIFGATSQALSAHDMAALRVVCDGPMGITCRGVTGLGARMAANGIFSSCTGH